MTTSEMREKAEEARMQAARSSASMALRLLALALLLEQRAKEAV